MTQPNMKKEYRAELRSIETKLRGIDRNIDKIHRAYKRRGERFDKEVAKCKKLRRRDYEKTLTAVARPARSLMRRREILKGRLS